MTIISNSIQNIKKFKYFENAFLPKIVTVPLCQEKDVRYDSLVKKGDFVREGEIIARDKNNQFANIHSPVPGEVIDIISSIAPSGRKEYSIQIKLKGEMSFLGKKVDAPNCSFLSKNDLSDKLNEYGIINTFQTQTPQSLGYQIKNTEDKDISLVIRLFDEDDTRLTDSIITSFFLKEIIEAANFLASTIHAKLIVFATNNKNKFDLPSDTKIFENSIFLKMNNNKNPCGYKKDIIREFLKSQKKQTSYKLDENSLFLDSSTLYEVYKAFIQGIPATTKYVLFSGNCINSSCLLNVRIGTSIKEIVNQIGGFSKRPGLIVVNGMICGTSASSLNTPITKYVKSVYIISNKQFTDSHIYSCVNCGNCRSSCPGGISPDIIYANTINAEIPEEKYEKLALSCMGCGICNEVCPARLPLAQIMMVLRNRKMGNINEK